MTNRERYILQANEYDLLIKLQEGLGRSDSYCILDLITDKYNRCPDDTNCKDCIQKWLNAEEDCNELR